MDGDPTERTTPDLFSTAAVRDASAPTKLPSVEATIRALLGPPADTPGGEIRVFEEPLNAQLPTIFAEAEFARRGGLMSYGPDFPAMFGRAADYVDKILRGANPGELPVQQPINFDLVINLKTAKALGLVKLLALANDVVEE